jgi:hypothetical protein
MAWCAHHCRPVDAGQRRRAAWVLLVLAVMVLRGALLCHDGAAAGSAVDRLIAASLCITGGPGSPAGTPGEGPLTPAGDSTNAPPACLHCTSGQGGALLLVALGLLAFAGWRPLRLPRGKAPGRLSVRWPTVAARGPPWAPALKI